MYFLCCSMHFLCCSMHFFLCCSMWCLFCDVPGIVCVYMCTVLLPPGGYPIAVKYIISYKCLSEAKASHSQRMWAEVSSSAPHLLNSKLSDSPIRWRCLLRVLCPVRRPLTALDCVLLMDRYLALALRQGAEINSRACLIFQGSERLL
jgi:hypothetical protein